MEIRLDAGGVEECLGKVSAAIDDLSKAATDIDTAMSSLADYWKGAAYDHTMSVYESEYKSFLNETIPTNVESLRAYIQKCKDTILEVDSQLAGGGN